MSTLETIDGITYVLRDDGTAFRVADPAATPAPVASAPAEPAAASPFALAGVTLDVKGKAVTDERPEAIRAAAAAAPAGKAQEWARQAARVGRIAGFACSETATVGGVEMAAHGYAWAGESGSKCKSPGCPGKIL